MVNLYLILSLQNLHIFLGVSTFPSKIFWSSDALICAHKPVHHHLQHLQHLQPLQQHWTYPPHWHWKQDTLEQKEFSRFNRNINSANKPRIIILLLKKYGLLGVLCIDRVNGDEGVIGGEAGVGNEVKVNVRLKIGQVAKLVVRREASSKAEHFKNRLWKGECYLTFETFPVFSTNGEPRFASPLA